MPCRLQNAEEIWLVENNIRKERKDSHVFSASQGSFSVRLHRERIDESCCVELVLLRCRELLLL